MEHVPLKFCELQILNPWRKIGLEKKEIGPSSSL